MANFTSCHRFILLYTFSATFMIFGIWLILNRHEIYNSIADKVFELHDGNRLFNIWKKNGFPMELKLYLFNWTNAEDVYNKSVKPHFQELGPYTFAEEKEKVNITWNDNDTVSYYHMKRWWFDSSKSNGSLDDSIISINPIALSAAVTVKEWSFLLKQGLNSFLRSTQNGIQAKHKVAEVLFDGYEDPMLSVAHTISELIPSIPGYDKFGWFYKRNNSETFEGQFNMNTGQTGELGQLRSWTYMKRTPYYQDKCGDVTGSAGEFFPRNLLKDSYVTFFSPDLCRYAQLEFEKELAIGSLTGYKYAANDRFLDNGTIIPENKCFCNGNCMPYGALNISTCRYGSPAFVSLPHFYKADSYYRSTIEGMRPKRDKHDFFMVFEPNTGIPLQVSVRLQVNLLLEPIPGVAFYDKVPKVYVPILWFDQTINIPDEIIVYVLMFIKLPLICFFIGHVLVLISLAFAIYYYYYN